MKHKFIWKASCCLLNFKRCMELAAKRRKAMQISHLTFCKSAPPDAFHTARGKGQTLASVLWYGILLLYLQIRQNLSSFVDQPPFLLTTPHTCVVTSVELRQSSLKQVRGARPPNHGRTVAYRSERERGREAVTPE